MRDPLTDEILFGRLEHGGTVTITTRRRTPGIRVRSAHAARSEHLRSERPKQVQSTMMPTKSTRFRSRSSIAAGGRAADDGSGAGAVAASKPTYVEELERQLAEKDRIAQEYIARYRQAAS